MLVGFGVLALTNSQRLLEEKMKAAWPIYHLSSIKSITEPNIDVNDSQPSPPLIKLKFFNAVDKNRE